MYFFGKNVSWPNVSRPDGFRWKGTEPFYLAFIGAIFYVETNLHEKASNTLSSAFGHLRGVNTRVQSRLHLRFVAISIDKLIYNIIF
jgi:hypothetical protein